MICVAAVSYTHLDVYKRQVLGVSRSGFYDWLKALVQKSADEERRLEDEIKQIFAHSRQSYGSRRVTKELKKRGILSSRRRIRKMMRRLGPVSYTHLDVYKRQFVAREDVVAGSRAILSISICTS